VFTKPVVSIFSTGDELKDPENNESDLRLGEIYDANRTALKALLLDLPIDLIDLGILPDDKEKISSSMLRAAQKSDLLVTSGGVSVGDADHVVDAISEMGKLDFWRLNLKPGKPLAYGSINNTPIIGLPGNPVSTIVTALLLLKPVLTHLCGSVPTPPTRLKASLDGELSHQIGRAEYMRARFTQKNKEVWVSSNQDQSSNRLSSFLNSNCLIEIPKEEGNVSAGSTVDIIPLNFI
jgi:molybdopterin molybdotransferase